MENVECKLMLLHHSCVSCILVHIDMLLNYYKTRVPEEFVVGTSDIRFKFILCCDAKVWESLFKFFITH